jgi:tetratricopeptide (TPR) repeat protein
MRPEREPASAAGSGAFELLSTYYFERRQDTADLAMRRLCDRLRNEPASVWLDCAKMLASPDLPQASQLLESARSRYSSDRPLLQFSAELFKRQGDEPGYLQALQRLLLLEPENEPAALELAVALRDSGRMQAAAGIVLRHLTGPTTVERILGAASFLEGCRRTADAYTLCRRGLDHGLKDVRLYYDAGVHALSLGRFDEARALLRAAVDAPEPEWAALLPLALSQRHTPEELADIPRYRAAWESASITGEARAFAGFALAKAHDDLGDYAAAAQCSREANRIVHHRREWSAAAWTALVHARLSGSERPIPRLPPAPSGARPIFIIGLPRTGTTLVAELLGRHEAITNRGELHWISFLDEQLRRSGRLRDPAALRVAANWYRAHLRQDDAPTPFYVDKNPLNFRHLEFIRALFPEARIVHCRRLPRDTALSNWMQMLGHSDTAWAYDFDDIANYFAGHDQLMSHWPARLQLPVHTIDYETLAQHPEACVAAMLDFIGLPQHDLTSAAGAPDRSIGTASVWQARQPVTAGSIGRWRQYADHLPELVEKFPY